MPKEWYIPHAVLLKLELNWALCARGSRVIGANMGGKLFVALQLEVPHRFIPKIYPWAQQKNQTARSIPSKQNHENALVRPIQACGAHRFLTEWSSFRPELS